MKVTLATHGGQAAAINIRLPPRVVDSEALPEPAAGELSRDAMSYMITIEERGQSTTLAQSDVTMSAQFAALLNWLQRHAA